MLPRPTETTVLSRKVRNSSVQSAPSAIAVLRGLAPCRLPRRAVQAVVIAPLFPCSSQGVGLPGPASGGLAGRWHLDVEQRPGLAQQAAETGVADLPHAAVQHGGPSRTSLHCLPAGDQVELH